MSDEQTTQAVEVEQTEQTGEPTTGAGTVDQLPDWARRMIGDLRSENAKHRKAKTEAEKAAELASLAKSEADGKYQEVNEQLKGRVAELETALKSAEVGRLKSAIASKHNLPAALVDRLRGDTEEELEADAKALLDALPKMQPATRTDGGAGVNGAIPTPKKSDQEIRELAARLGVNFELLKQQYQ